MRGAPLSLYRVLLERGLVGVAADLFGGIFVADAIIIPIHTLVYVLWMGILQDCPARGLIKHEQKNTDDNAPYEG